MLSFALSPYISINLFLSTMQFCLIAIILVNIEMILDIDDFFPKFFKILRYILIVAVIYSLLLSFLGNYTYEFGVRKNYLIFSFISQDVHGYIGDLGYSSFYTNPNIFGYYLLMFLCYTLFVDNILKKENIFNGVIILIGILLANSRAINILGVCAIFVFLFNKLNLRLKYIVVPLVFLGIGTLFVYFISSGLLFEGDFLTGRLELWGKMIDTIKQYPIFGTGFASSSKYVVGSLERTVGSHNSYLNILCENGVIGFSIFIVILLLIGKKAIVSFLKDRLENKYLLLSSCIFLLMIPYAFFENAYMIIDSRNFIWILMCLIINKSSKKISTQVF